LRQFRRIRIPRVHGVQRTSLAAARMKHMRDRDVQKDRLAKAGGNIGFGWIWEYDPVASWDKVPVVPAIE
jgi:salicylate hydroxylase